MFVNNRLLTNRSGYHCSIIQKITDITGENTMQQSQQKTDRRVLYTKRILRETLLELMQEKPIARITPTELCRRADMNRNTFYTHYDSPEALLKSIEGELYEQVKSSIDSSLNAGSISALLTEICQAIYDSRDLCAVLFSEYGDKDFLWQIIDLAHDRTLLEWQAVGLPDNRELAEMLYCFSANGSVAVIQQWILHGMQKSPFEIAQFIEQTSYFGLQGFMQKFTKF